MYQNLNQSSCTFAQVAHRLCLLTILLMLVFSVAKPAYAGYWQWTGTIQGSDTSDLNGKTNTTSWTYNPTLYGVGYFVNGVDDMQGFNYASSSGKTTVTYDWVANSIADPPPPMLYLREHSFVGIKGSYFATSDGSNGCGDPFLHLRGTFSYGCYSYSEGFHYLALNASSGHVVVACNQSVFVNSVYKEDSVGTVVAFDVSIMPPPPFYISSTTPDNPNPIIWKPATMTSVPLSATIIHPPSQLTVNCSIYDSTQTLVKFLTRTVTATDDSITVPFTWDGTNGYSSPVPAGVYLFKFSAQDPTSLKTDTDKSTSLLITAPNANAQPISDDGTNAQFAVGYTLFRPDYSTRSAAAGKIDVYDVNQSLVATQVLKDADLTPGPHTVNISIPSSAVDIDGHNTFLVSAQDNDADLDTVGHRNRWALQHNQKGPSLPIVYIKSDIWHVAWCRKNKPVGLSTQSIKPINRATHIVKHIVQDGAALPNTVIAASNGSLYSYFPKNVLPPLGGIGVGTIGHWKDTAIFANRQLFSFGMPASGGGFAYARMKRVPIKLGVRRLIKFYVADGIQQGYPYGFGCVGLLVDKGAPVGYNDYDGQWNTLQLSPTSPEPRTALGWTKEGDFFIVTCNGIHNTPAGAQGKTWDDVKNFLVTGLPQIVQQKYHTTVSTYGAVMLDGGGSTMFDYRNMDQNGKNIQTDQGAPQGLDTQIITDYVLAVGDTSK